MEYKHYLEYFQNLYKQRKYIIFGVEKEGFIMSVTMRKYKMLSDFEKVSSFYVENYKVLNKFNTQTCFEFSHTHGGFAHKKAHHFGIWEENGQIVATACFEIDIGTYIPFIKEGYEYLQTEMLKYAEKELCYCDNNIHSLEIFSTDKQNLNAFYVSNGYSIINTSPILIYPYDKGFHDCILPEGFSMVSLNDENDTEKIDRCLWTAFSSEPYVKVSSDERLHKQSGPRFRRDLATVVKAPNGDYACYAGMWIDEKNGFAYLEPLGTAPEYRKLGLAKAALMEAMKKTVPFGATYCYCGSINFYRSIGCEEIGIMNTWKKEW